MCTKYRELTFTHFIIDGNEDAVFGSARVNDNGRIANFLINGVVKQHDGIRWQQLDEESAEVVRKHALSAYSRIPTFYSYIPLF
jgi:hypothetical protein